MLRVCLARAACTGLFAALAAGGGTLGTQVLLLIAGHLRGLFAALAAGGGTLGTQVLLLIAGHLRLQEIVDQPPAFDLFDKPCFSQRGDVVVGAAEERAHREVLHVPVAFAVDGVRDGEHP